jgi:hypothetical protein
VYRDGLAMRCVPDRLARDFWVKPDEKMVRLWCRAFAAEIDFAVDYQPWLVANFSGILCVDEVYQGDLALLLAVDPAAPDGDRLIGYTCRTPRKSITACSKRSSSDCGVLARTLATLGARLSAIPAGKLASGIEYRTRLLEGSPGASSLARKPRTLDGPALIIDQKPPSTCERDEAGSHRRVTLASGSPAHE